MINIKTPKPRKLKSGTWFIQLRLDGQSIPVTAETKIECERKAELIKAQYRNDHKTIAHRSAANMTLLEVMEKYIKDSTPVLSPATIRGYEYIKRKRFEKYRSKKLSAIKWQQMINEELEDVSEKTVKNAWGFITPALKNVSYPVPEIKLAKVPVKDLRFLQPEEIKPFCAALKGRSFEIPILLELHGLRLSEVLGLEWKDIDLKKNVITVNGAKVRGIDGKLTYKKTNKNKTSTRQLPILIPQLEKALSAVSESDRSGFVVNANHSSLLHDVERTCKRAGVTHVTNHDLRRSFMSLCYHLHISERQTMAWGGYADYHTMHKIYIKLAASDESSAADAVKQFFSDQDKGNSKD